MSNSKVVYEGPMFRYGRRRMIGRSNLHIGYFVLDHNLLAYYKKKPKSKQVPIKSLLINGNCRVEDGSLTVNRNMVYVLYIYNKKEKNKCITMAAFNIEEALMWKKKIEFVIDQHQESPPANANKFTSFEYTSALHNGQNSSSSDQESQHDAQEDEDDSCLNLSRRTTVGNDLSEGLLEFNSEWSSDYNNTQAFSSKHWHLLQCQNGLRIFEELGDDDYLPRSCSRAMKAVGVVEATCEEIFRLVMSLDSTRFEWDCSFHTGRIVEEVDGHTAILYHRLQLDWFPVLIWPRDLCYVRYWRRNEDGSYLVVFRSQEHENCGPHPGCVRAHVESGGFNISPLKPQNGRPRAKVQYLMQIDFKGWVVGYIRPFQLHCLLQMLNGVAGLREWFAQTDKKGASQRISAMLNLTSAPVSSPKAKKPAGSSIHSLDQCNNGSRNSVPLEDSSDDDEEFQMADMGQEEFLVAPVEDAATTVMEEQVEQIDLSCFRGNLRHDDEDKSRNCWRISDGNNFRVRSKKFLIDKSKTPAGKPLMNLAAVDWFKDRRRMDHVARHRGRAAQVASEKGLFTLIINVQVPGPTHYSMVFYFVTKELVPGSLLQQFVDMDDEFRNSRFKLIPSVPQGSWIVRQSVGGTPCLLGKAVDCNYIRGPQYLEIDIDIGSSTVAKGVLGLVFGVITTLVVDMAFLVQANTTEELPERLIGAVRVSHVELSSAIVPELDTEE